MRTLSVALLVFAFSFCDIADADTGIPYISVVLHLDSYDCTKGFESGIQSMLMKSPENRFTFLREMQTINQKIKY